MLGFSSPSEDVAVYPVLSIFIIIYVFFLCSFT